MIKNMFCIGSQIDKKMNCGTVIHVSSFFFEDTIQKVMYAEATSKNCHEGTKIQYPLEFQVEPDVQSHSGCVLKVGVNALAKEPPFQIFWICP